jgi:hypothetical protein
MCHHPPSTHSPFGGFGRQSTALRGRANHFLPPRKRVGELARLTPKSRADESDATLVYRRFRRVEEDGTPFVFNPKKKPLREEWEQGYIRKRRQQEKSRPRG